MHKIRRQSSEQPNKQQNKILLLGYKRAFFMKYLLINLVINNLEHTKLITDNYEGSHGLV